MNTMGLSTMIGIQLRTGWRVTLAWVLALAATMLGTTASISGLYDTQAKIDSYARAVGSGDALLAINGHVYGLDSLGGVIANEFGFMASFALPLMGISLIARGTRRDEESGRLEVLLAGRIGRSAPLVSAVTVTTGALVVTCAALVAGLVATGVPVAGSVVYAASLGALGLVFAGIAAVAAQVVQHSRGVYAISLGALVVAYLLRGVGDVLDNAVTWLSPLGWAEEMRAFGDARWWPILIPLALALVLGALAVGLTGARDLGSAMLRRGASASRASAFLRSPFGFAVAMHRGAVVGWAIGAILLSGTFGALAQQLIDAMAGNESLEEVLGGSGTANADGFLAMSVLLLALVCSAFVIQAVGTLRSEETAGRLEPALSGELGRTGWLTAQVCTILAGIAVVAFLGALALGLSAAWSTGDAAQTGRLVTAVVSYLPAALALGAFALLLFGAYPRVQPLAWLVFAFVAVEAMLGEALQLPAWVSSISPMDHVGYPPQDPVNGAGVATLVVVTLVLGGVALAGFRRRGIPQG